PSRWPTACPRRWCTRCAGRSGRHRGLLRAARREGARGRDQPRAARRGAGGTAPGGHCAEPIDAQEWPLIADKQPYPAVSYPVACTPQAWATAERVRVRVSGDAQSWLGRAELHGLRVGAASVSLAFTQVNGITGFSALDQRGQLTVTTAHDAAM